MATRQSIDPIHGAITISEIEAAIIDTPPVQRMRHIKQLGNVHLLFPQATHTRFAHSLGVMHVSGQYFDALFSKQTSVAPAIAELIANVRQHIRVAGLLHDIGHGPLSHHFENCLKYVDGPSGRLKKCKASFLCGNDLEVPGDWIVSKKEYDKEELKHEHYSYGVINYILSRMKPNGINAQDICALLDKRFMVSGHFQKKLEDICEACFSCANYNSLLDCLRQILSGEVDADRLDYLRRDAFNCGVGIGNVDYHHLFGSIYIGVDKSKRDSSGNSLAECYIAIKPNAVTAYEQVLLSRKQMFDQVYTHRLNSSFDSMIERIIDYLIPKHIISPPRTYREFLAMRDSTIEFEIEKLAFSMKDEVDVVRCAHMLISRTALKRLHETIVPLHKVEKEKNRLEKEYSLQGRVVVSKSALKELTKSSRDDVRSKSDIWRVEPESDSIGPTHITNASELLSSTVYRNANARLVVFKTDEESAKERKLADRIALAVPPEIVERVYGKKPSL